jgi:signal transduction histidine kinase
MSVRSYVDHQQGTLMTTIEPGAESGSERLLSMLSVHLQQGFCVLKMEEGDAKPAAFRVLHSNAALDSQRSSLLEGLTTTASSPRNLKRLRARLAAASRTGTAIRFTISCRQQRFKGFACSLDGSGSGKVALVLEPAADGSAGARSAAETALEALRIESIRKNVLLATVAHELRNMMDPIGSVLEIVRCSADPQQVGRSVTVAQRQLQQMSRVIGDLVEIGRVMNAQVEVQLTRQRLQDLVAEAAQACDPVAAKGEQRITLDLPDAPLWIDADPVRFGQVLSNLLQNAIKFSNPGGRIQVAARQDGRHAELRVSDDGVGIDPGDLETIFDVFARAHSRAGPTGGLGIGLWLARHLMQLHGGTVQAISAGPGLGATFTVRLPLATERRASALETMEETVFPSPSAVEIGDWPRRPPPLVPGTAALWNVSPT